MDYVNVTSWNVTMSLNSTTTTVATARSGGPCSEGLAFFRLVTEVYIPAPIALIGILGNIMAFIVLCCQKRKISTTVILLALAVVDTLILLTVFPLKTLYYSSVCLGTPQDYKETWKLCYRYMYPLLFVLRMIDTWLIVFLSIDRWIAVSKPLHAPRLCTLRRTFIELVILIICAIVFGAPRWFESTQYGFLDTHHDVTVLNSYDWYIYTYKLGFFFLFMYLIPMTLMIVLNVQLILSLHKASRSMIGRRHSQSAHASQHRGVTVIVVSVVVTCVVCNLLAMFSHVLYSLVTIDKEKYAEQLGDARGYISQTSNVFIVLNSSINFFLYCFSSKNFRQNTLRAFRLESFCARVGNYSLARTDATDMRSEDMTTTLTTQTNGHLRGENEMQMKELLSK